MSLLNYLARKPSTEKIRRGVNLIESLLDQFPWYEDAERALKFYPNYRTDYRDYSAVIRVARSIVRKPYRFVTEGEGPVGGGWNGRWGHTERKGCVNLSEVIEKAVERIYEREQQQGIPDEEITVWIKNAEQSMTTQEGSPDWSRIESSYKKEIIPRIPRSKDEIRGSLTSKWLEYVQRKNSG